MLVIIFGVLIALILFFMLRALFVPAVLILGGLWFYMRYVQPFLRDDRTEQQHVATPTAPTCTTDWRLCRDNEELANNWSGIPRVQGSCLVAAKARARSGTPEFPANPFSQFQEGSATPRSGILQLYEPGARYSEGGADTVPTGVLCQYDLKTETVTDIITRR